jgi:hypothetical protein
MRSGIRILVLLTVVCVTAEIQAATATVSCNDGSSWIIFAYNPDNCDPGATGVAAVACGGVRGGIAPGTFVCPAKVKPCAAQGNCFNGVGGQFCVLTEGRCAPGSSPVGLAILAIILVAIAILRLGKQMRDDAPSG